MNLCWASSVRFSIKDHTSISRNLVVHNKKMAVHTTRNRLIGSMKTISMMTLEALVAMKIKKVYMHNQLEAA